MEFKLGDSLGNCKHCHQKTVMTVVVKGSDGVIYKMYMIFSMDGMGFSIFFHF